MKAVLPARARDLLEPRLPDDLAIVWFDDHETANAAIADADIAWVDQSRTALTAATIAQGERLRWLFTVYAGIDSFDQDRLKARGTTVTNGAGINAYAVAEYAVMGVLVAAKRLDRVIHAGDAREWLADSPGKTELHGTAALVIGYGAIGRLIGARLAAFDVEVTGVTRSGGDGTIGADDWRARLGAFDWVVLAAPSTDATRAMIGADELAAMKPDAWLINIARGDMVDQGALIAALEDGTIGGAFLDTVDPEPLPADHPLWSAPNAIVTMHSAGRSQSKMIARAADLFCANLAAFRAGEPMTNVVDLDEGY